ncbi:MAG: hypothetical protein DSY47_06405, partial [Hydrogenothermus sp.]
MLSLTVHKFLLKGLFSYFQSESGLFGFAIYIPPFYFIFKQAFILTALITGSLTAYVFITKKDFSFIGGFLFVGLILV